MTGLQSASVVEFLPFHGSTATTTKLSSFSSPENAAVVPNDHLKQVSTSVVMAERWTRDHVLSHYPSMNITSIVVGHNLLCKDDNDDELSLILPSMKNIHYTLTRWGLHMDIKVSASFSSSCVHQQSGRYRDDLGETYIRPLLSFLQNINSSYFVNLPSHLITLPDETESLINSHSKAIQNLGFLNMNKFNVISIQRAKEVKFPSRKLSFFFPFPSRPTPSAEDNAPTTSPSPANVAKSPLPPLIGKISPPPLSLPLAPAAMPPISTTNPAHPPTYGFTMPPCYSPPDGHSGGAVAAPVGAPSGRGLWCVAKPSVPPETLQVALDYACGEGGADCEAIKPRGNCYYPDTVLAHASYAFNSYWQKTKKMGGTCGFEGTAMLIDSDPSIERPPSLLLSSCF